MVTELANILFLGLQASCPTGIVGSTLRCSCSSDIPYTSIGWYHGNSTRHISSNSRTLTIPVTTDDQGGVYTCSMSTRCGSGTQSKVVTITTEGRLPIIICHAIARISLNAWAYHFLYPIMIKPKLYRQHWFWLSKYPHFVSPWRFMNTCTSLSAYYYAP